MINQEVKLSTPPTVERLEARERLLSNMAGIFGLNPSTSTIAKSYSPRLTYSERFRKAVKKARAKTLKIAKQRKIKAKRKAQKYARKKNR